MPPPSPSPEPDRSYLSIRGVNKAFRVDGRPLQALSGIDLEVEQGSFVTIVGASGCGKSTLLRIVAGLESGEGSVLHAGEEVTEPSLDRGLVFQEPRLFPWLTVEQNVSLGLENAPVNAATKRQLVREHLELVSLSDFANAYPRQLSGGMAQRVAIARGLVNRPGLLLLDEPFGALDAFTRARLQDELQLIWQQERITALLVTHDVDEAVLLGGRIVVMSPRPGRIAEVIDVPFDYPRDRRAPELTETRNHILDTLDSIRDGVAARAPLKSGAKAPGSREVAAE